MKLVQFGLLVLGAHIVGFVLIFVYPGCRSTPSGDAPTPVNTAASDPASPQPMPADDLYAPEPAPSPLEASPFGGTTPSSGQVRLPPTRPGPGQLDVPPPPPEFIEYVVRSGDSLWAIARRVNVPIDRITAANNINRSTTLQVGQTLRIPQETAPGVSGDVVLPTSSPSAPAQATYTVRSGDSLSVIARRYGTTVAAIRAANNLAGDRIDVGQELRLPAGAAPSGDSGAATAATPSGEATTHVVLSGETIGAIARRYGVSAADILELNGIRDPRRLRAGDTIRIPGRGGVSRPAPAPAPAYAEPAPDLTAQPLEPMPETLAPSPEPILDAPSPVPADDVPVTPVQDEPAP